MMIIIMSLRLEENCYHSTSSERPSGKTDVKNSQRVNNNEEDKTQKNSKSRLCGERRNGLSHNK